MTDDYTPTPDPRDNPHGYAYWLTNRDAAAYAAEYLDNLDSLEDADPDEWAHETADGMAAVIYTYQALALYAAGILDHEDDGDLHIDPTKSAIEVIDQLVTGLAFTWHRRILTEAIEEAIEERSNDEDQDDEDQAPEVTA